MIQQADVAHRPIDLRFCFGRARLSVLRQRGLGALDKSAFERSQKNDAVKILFNRQFAQAAEAFYFKDVFDPVSAK